MNTTNATITSTNQSTIELKGTISWEDLLGYEIESLKHFGATLELDGFRKGAVPETLVKKHLGDELLLTDMAERAISAYYAQVVHEHSLQVIGKPSVAITKIARDNELAFTITTAILPTIALPDYKTIAQGIPTEEATPVTDEDVSKVVEELRELRAYGHIHGKDETHDHPEPLPEVDDAFAKSFGNFESVEAMREKIKENLVRERDHHVNDKRRISIMEAILTATDVVVPEVLISAEQQNMMAQFETDIARTGNTLDGYLKETSMTRESLAEQYKPEAEKRAKVQLVINAIARDADIKIEEKELAREVDNIMAMYPGADKGRAEAYAEMILINEKVLSLLESVK